MLALLLFGLTGVCTDCWHFLVVVGMLGGMRTPSIFIVPVVGIWHSFCQQRGVATGRAVSACAEEFVSECGLRLADEDHRVDHAGFLGAVCLIVRGNFPPNAASSLAKAFPPSLSICILSQSVLVLTMLCVLAIK
jgi:hypothetical protein